MLRSLTPIDETNDDGGDGDGDDRQRELMTSPTSSTCCDDLRIEVAENNTRTETEETGTTTKTEHDDDIDDDDSFLFSFDFRQKQFYLPDNDDEDDDVYGDDDHIIHIRHSHTWEEGGIVRHSRRWEKGDNINIDEVYVAVGNTVSSAEALVWTLRHGGVAGPSTVLYLVHVYPRTRNIPTPLGKFPIGKMNPQVVQKYLIQERNKRRRLLQSFLDVCSIFKVKAEIIMIESDMVAQAILELIPIVNIRKLILGTAKPTFCHGKWTKPHKSGKIGIAHQVLQHAPVSCDVVVIYHDQPMVSCHLIPTVTPPPRAADTHDTAPGPTKADSTRAWNWLSRFNIFTIPAGRGRLSSGNC